MTTTTTTQIESKTVAQEPVLNVHDFAPDSDNLRGRAKVPVVEAEDSVNLEFTTHTVAAESPRAQKSPYKSAYAQDKKFMKKYTQDKKNLARTSPAKSPAKQRTIQSAASPKKGGASPSKAARPSTGIRTYESKTVT